MVVSILYTLLAFVPMCVCSFITETKLIAWQMPLNTEIDIPCKFI
jgi:hypothetical protein